MGESDVDQLIAPVYTRYINPVCTILAGLGDIQVHLRARCATAAEAEALLAEVGDPIESLLGDRIYSRGGEPLEAVTGELLRAAGATLSVAESCTGGMLAERITSVAGSSDYFAGGFLVYTKEMKTRLLGVDPALLAEHGAVHETVAEAMAQGARERTGSSYALSVTGVAGPGSGGEQAPPGTVCIGLASPGGVNARRVQFLGDRARVRSLASQTALDLLRRKVAAARPPMS
jgi:nicotinamide-nucleotide amidase